MADRHDVFVGNLTFNTTEEQLREKFSFVGPVKNIRILTDKESGKPKGFAFVEYYDANTALSAIRHLDQTELNSRKLKVGYPAQSNLKDIARQIGQVVPESSADFGGGGAGSGTSGAVGGVLSAASRLQIEQSVIQGLKLHTAWDLLEAMKKLVAEDNNRGQKAKAILEAHPQLISAFYEIQKRLGIALPKNVLLLQQQQSALLTVSAETGPVETNSLGKGAGIGDWPPVDRERDREWDSLVAAATADRDRDRDRDSWSRERDGSGRAMEWGDTFAQQQHKGAAASAYVPGDVRAGGSVGGIRPSAGRPHSSAAGSDHHPYAAEGSAPVQVKSERRSRFSNKSSDN
jgi:cleavage stimulation factor subunit 2